jgi:MFS transporter, DHA1 family, multidrug resistance protein
MRDGMFKTAVILGLLSAVGPFAIDMYLPAMPSVAADLGATASQAQNTLVAFFVAFGIAQLFYGPWADHSGRKPPLYFGLALFALASVGCAMAQSITALIVLRFLQGLGASVVMVVPRAVIRDLYTGPAATRLFALVMLVISVSPMLAPLAGAGLIALSGWRLIFWVLAGAALISLLMTATLQRETLSPENRVPFNLASMLSGSRSLLFNRRFMALTFIGGFGIASFLVFIAMAPFVYQEHFGLSPTGFSLAFAANAIGFFAASQMAAPLGERLGMDRMVRLASWGFAGFNLLLTLLALAGLASLPVTIACLVVANAFVGLIMPTTMVMSLDDHGDIAGLASSLGGTLQMVAGGVIATIFGLFHNGTVLPMAIGMLACALGCLVLAQTISRPAESSVRAA